MISQRIYELRMKKGMAQKELASLVGVSVSTISNYENGVHKPDVRMAKRIARFFDVSVDYLYGMTDIERYTDGWDRLKIGGVSAEAITKRTARLSEENQRVIVNLISCMEQATLQVAEDQPFYRVQDEE